MQKSLNELTAEDLQLVEELAAYFFTPKEIGKMLELDQRFVELAMDVTDDLLNQGYNPSDFYIAFNKGRLQSEMELRKSIIKLAKSGSSPAQTMSLDLLKKSQIKMMP